MKFRMTCAAMLLVLLAAGPAVAEDKPDLLIYINPNDFSREVQLGVMPFSIKWIRKGPAIEAAAREALAPYFSSVALCDGTSGADVLVGIKADLTYNPGIQFYYAKIQARFHLGNGKVFGAYKATGEVNGFIGSAFAERQVQEAFSLAMRGIVQQYAADAAAQQTLAAMPRDQTKVPCALIGAIPNP
ncbi:hypothetical protein GALL_362170 [mine drainage metagenome]|uniref:Uncharacterized protein n=1 Tax=mine drainage metagenome TaxID=410659 RepID=A0A1J5QX10_9ZZZZ